MYSEEPEQLAVYLNPMLDTTTPKVHRSERDEASSGAVLQRRRGWKRATQKEWVKLMPLMSKPMPLYTVGPLLLDPVSGTLVEHTRRLGAVGINRRLGAGRPAERGKHQVVNAGEEQHGLRELPTLQLRRRYPIQVRDLIYPAPEKARERENREGKKRISATLSNCR